MATRAWFFKLCFTPVVVRCLGGRGCREAKRPKVVGECLAWSGFEKTGEVIGFVRFALGPFGLLFVLPQGLIRAAAEPVFFPFARFDDDRGTIEQALGVDVHPIAACLAEPATDAGIGIDDRGVHPRPFDGVSVGIEFGADAGEVDREVTGADAFVDADPCREVGFDRVERTDRDALVAMDATRFDLPLAETEQIPQRKNGPAGTDVLAPKTWLQKTQSQNRREQRQR